MEHSNNNREPYDCSVVIDKKETREERIERLAQKMFGVMRQAAKEEKKK